VLAHRRPLLVSMGLFIIACATPALVLHAGSTRGSGVWIWQDYRSMSGISLLITGLLAGWLRSNFAAYANLGLFLSWFYFARRRFKAARLSATVALLLSFETLQLIVQPYLFDEGGVVQGYLTAPHLGYFCWLGSMLAIWFGSHRALRLKSNSELAETRSTR
jgi:hypothetical protein